MKATNNILNIRYNKSNNWKGQLGHKDGFCAFASVDYCVRSAAYLIMRSYRRNGVFTINDIIHRYAPPFDNNNTSNYVRFVTSMLHKDKSYIPCSSADVAALLTAMYMFETGDTKVSLHLSKYNPTYMLSVINEFKLSLYNKRSYEKEND